MSSQLATRSPNSEVKPIPLGLTHEEAQQRLVEFGHNDIPDVRPPLWHRILMKLWGPIPGMLELAIVLELVLGDYVQAVVIALLLFFNTGLSLFKEAQVQATLDVLRSQLALVCSVKRNGTWQTISATELVPGDIIQLSMGHIVGADVHIIDGDVLLDHSMLTGESLPIEAGTGTKSYAGALVRRGEAIAEVTATALHTRFGRTAELIRTAHVGSSQEKVVMRVMRNLALFNGSIVIIQLLYAIFLHLPIIDIIPLTLTSILAAIPVALPATFTLARVMSAHALTKQGVLPSQLSAVDEAATMDVLVVDKTGTLTQNELSVTEVRAMPGFDEQRILALAALASSEGGQDTVDAAIRAAAQRLNVDGLPQLRKFIPFDPANKMAEALALDDSGHTLRIVKGAVDRVASITLPTTEALATAQALAERGYRVLALGVGSDDVLQFAGLIALSDPPRKDSTKLIATLNDLGVRTVMATGDAPVTAAVIAQMVGLKGSICSTCSKKDELRTDSVAVFAGVTPEDKFHIVQAFQKKGHTVGMCGDGTNDAPALHQAQVGIAVSAATDVAKSAAGIVLTVPGLAGIIVMIKEGRVTFQRILTYTLRIVAMKIQQLMFLIVGLLITGHAIFSPMLMVFLMITGDFLAMSSSTDNVTPSDKPNTWRINNLTKVGIILALCYLIFSSSVLAIGKFWLKLDQASLMTLAALTMVFNRQGLMYMVRERRHLWSSRPSFWLIATSLADVVMITTLASYGILIAALPIELIMYVMIAELLFAFVIDAVKIKTFRHLGLV